MHLKCTCALLVYVFLDASGVYWKFSCLTPEIERDLYEKCGKNKFCLCFTIICTKLTKHFVQQTISISNTSF